jgi:hypothetical protein
MMICGLTLITWPNDLGIGLIPDQHLILDLCQHQCFFPTSKFNFWSDHGFLFPVRWHSKSYDNTSYTSKTPSVPLTDNARLYYQFLLVLLLFVIAIGIVRLVVYAVFPYKNCSHFSFWPHIGPFELDGWSNVANCNLHIGKYNFKVIHSAGDFWSLSTRESRVQACEFWL